MCWFLLSTTSFAGKCKVVEIRISTTESEAMFLIWKWSTHKMLSQVEEFKYLVQM